MDELDDLIPRIGTDAEFVTDPDFKPSPIAYYCRDCNKLVKIEKKGKKEICVICKGNNVSMGTERSLRNFYKISSK